MPLMLLKLIPFRDYLYAALAIAAVTYYNVHVHNLIRADEHTRNVAVAAESAKVMAQAQATIAAQAKDYADREAATEENYENQFKADDLVHAADLQRLRQLAAQSGTSSALGGAAGSGSSPDSGGSSLVGLGYVSEGLASALRDARNDLAKCYANRDSLTGK